MSIVRRRTLVRAAAVTACAGSLLAVPTAAALAEGLPAASSAHSPAPQRTLVKTLALADGVSTANVYRVSKGVYQAEILGADGHRTTTLTSDGGSTGGAGALHAALDSDGRLTSWAGNVTDPRGGHVIAGDGHKTGTRSGHSVPVAASGKAGTVQRLGNLADGPGEGVLLLAAGGGIAAIGAAGLGFAMLRRGRTNG
ncbi:hypothetical protein [Streptomyces sp. NPDC002467]|uniref:hypothetical protein n=1 Tax=Streptomyces sp. NPDC002467 TaxID=3364647 RepID=UPI00367FDFDE